MKLNSKYIHIYFTFKTKSNQLITPYQFYPLKSILFFMSSQGGSKLLRSKVKFYRSQVRINSTSKYPNTSINYAPLKLFLYLPKVEHRLS